MAHVIIPIECNFTLLAEVSENKIEVRQMLLAHFDLQYCMTLTATPKVEVDETP